MNLHLMNDDKYLDEFIRAAEEISPGENRYIINTRPPLRFVKTHLVEPAEYGTRSFFKIVDDIHQYERIFIHYLSQDMCKFINRYAQSEALFCWLYWGGDLYGYIPYSLYDHDTERIYRKISPISWIKGKLRPIIFRTERWRAIKRLDYIMLLDTEEMGLINKFYPTRARFFEYHYPNVVDFSHLDKAADAIEILPAVRERLGARQDLPLLQLGNSGFETNNHIEIMKLIAESNLQVQLLVPLSYGNPAYIRYLLREGKRMLGDRFISLVDYLNPADYARIVMSTDGSIFNSYRSQAFGNIRVALYLGKTVFINPKNTFYNLLLNRNISVHPTSRIMEWILSYPEKQDQKTIQKNREWIRSFLGAQEARRHIEAMFNL